MTADKPPTLQSLVDEWREAILRDDDAGEALANWLLEHGNKAAWTQYQMLATMHVEFAKAFVDRFLSEPLTLEQKVYETIKDL